MVNGILETLSPSSQFFARQLCRLRIYVVMAWLDTFLGLAETTHRLKRVPSWMNPSRMSFPVWKRAGLRGCDENSAPNDTPVAIKIRRPYEWIAMRRERALQDVGGLYQLSFTPYLALMDPVYKIDLCVLVLDVLLQKLELCCTCITAIPADPLLSWCKKFSPFMYRVRNNIPNFSNCNLPSTLKKYIPTTLVSTCKSLYNHNPNVYEPL